ncbi:MAG: hypothetical protein M1453_12020 [Acidobacteria bacterium]|nr:hypothetical protein [Acidobacteriota bacterium]MCL5288705.1 hypothetical protein [Acidobacteriota bacterium]
MSREEKTATYFFELGCSYFFGVVGVLLGAGVVLMGFFGAHFVGLDAADPLAILVGAFVVALGIASLVHGVKLKREPSRRLW